MDQHRYNPRVPRTDRRTTILQTAGKCFLDHGYDGTTMSQIAACLGGSKGTLWSYFSSKEELFAACIDEQTSAHRRELVSVLHPTAPLHQAVGDFCRSFIAKIHEPGAIALYRLLCGVSASEPQLRRLYFERGPGAVEAMLTGFLTGHVEARRLGGATASDMAQILISLCSGMSHQRLLLEMTPPDIVPMIPQAETVTGIFFKLYEQQGPLESQPLQE
jgi:AcrR family transcriptional regulator